MPFIAYADRSGVIGFGLKSPPEALRIGRHPDLDRLKTVVTAVARRAYDNKTLLVPGIPEAATDKDALDALASFTRRIEHRLKESES
jgi:hypothetical protein